MFEALDPTEPIDPSRHLDAVLTHGRTRRRRKRLWTTAGSLAIALSVVLTSALYLAAREPSDRQIATQLPTAQATTSNPPSTSQPATTTSTTTKPPATATSPSTSAASTVATSSTPESSAPGTTDPTAADPPATDPPEASTTTEPAASSSSTSQPPTSASTTSTKPPTTKTPPTTLPPLDTTITAHTVDCETGAVSPGDPPGFAVTFSISGQTMKRGTGFITVTATVTNLTTETVLVTLQDGSRQGYCGLTGLYLGDKEVVEHDGCPTPTRDADDKKGTIDPGRTRTIVEVIRTTTYCKAVEAGDYQGRWMLIMNRPMTDSYGNNTWRYADLALQRRFLARIID